MGKYSQIFKKGIMMEEKNRKTGINILGNAPWGTHFCQFYQTKEDLIDILVPYFKAGLEGNEFCMWVTSESLDEREAKKALKMAIPNFDRHLKRGQMEIVPYEEWYLKEGTFNLKRVLNAWIDKLNQALARGFDGIRVTGNTAWLEENDWRDFIEYEEEVNNVIDKHRMMAICSYSLDKCGASEIIDVVHNHQFALIKREGKWEIIESSERKKAEKDLRESEKRYRQLVELSPDTISIHSEGKIVFINNAGARLLGAANPDQLIGKSIMDFLHPDYREIVKERIKLAIKEGKEVPLIEEKFVRLDGTVIDVEVAAIPFTYYDKPAMQAIARDITERKRAERAMKASETKYRTIVENVNDALIIHDFEGKILDVNQNASELFGYECDEIIGKNIGKFSTQDSSRKIGPHMEQLIKKGKIVFDSEAQKKDGSIIPVNISARVVSQKGRGIIQLFVRDITERKRAEEALRESEEKYRTIFENVSDTIIYLDKYGTIIDANDKEETFGRKPKDIIGKNFAKLGFFKAKDIPKVLKLFKEVITGSKTIKLMEMEVKHKDGHEIPIEVSTSFIKKNGKIEGFVAIARDISERKRAEEKIKAALREKEVLLKEIHHRVKNNMQIISSLLKLQSEYIKEKKALQMFKDSQDRVKSMALIHEKLYQSKDLASIDFKDYIKDLVFKLFRSYEVDSRKITLRTNIKNISLGVDVAIPCGLITNELVSNCLKHAFPQGREGKIKVALRSITENKIELKVSDNGVGLPEDFDFRKAKSLGLHLVTILAEDQLHGKIELNRAGGTEFRIIFKRGK